MLIVHSNTLEYPSAGTFQINIGISLGLFSAPRKCERKIACENQKDEQIRPTLHLKKYSVFIHLTNQIASAFQELVFAALFLELHSVIVLKGVKFVFFLPA